MTDSLKINDFNRIDLILTNGEITSIIDVPTGVHQKAFHRRLTQSNIAKLYVVKEDQCYLYVGITMQSLTTRFRYGLSAVGKNGYYGYKWKSKEKVQLYVWSFNALERLEMENIEAELVLIIRQKTGLWPLNQNEIHFNNEFEEGKTIAEKLFGALEGIE